MPLDWVIVSASLNVLLSLFGHRGHCATKELPILGLLGFGTMCLAIIRWQPSIDGTAQSALVPGLGILKLKFNDFHLEKYANGHEPL